jgi:flagellar motor switch protein FliN/FliY
MGAKEPIQDNAGWLLEQLRAGLSQAVEAMTGEAPVIQASLTGDKPPEPLWWWQQPLSFPANATVCIGSAEADLVALGEHILRAVGVEPSPQEARSTYTETIQQALASLASSVGVKLHREVNCLPGKEFPGPPAVEAKFVMSGQSRCVIWLSFSPALIGGLDPGQPAPTKAVALGAGAMPPASGPPHALPSTMDLLLDVELPVSVSFGRAQLPLKDVIKLTTGSIVELNRSISEPVEVIVNNCVIARGEVVVVEGNYGVRIDHIISRQERLRTLK